MPDFLIIGAQKGGTTSLFYYLKHHPQIRLAPEKEVHYFDLQYHRGLQWYRDRFPASPIPDTQAGEASPYYLFHPDVPRRIAADFPHIKLIALLRDPVRRTLSHYHHAVKHQLETLPLETALDLEPQRLAGETEKLLQDPNYRSYAHQHHSYLARGRYLEQLQRWWDYFPRHQLLLLDSEAFYRNPQTTLDRTLDFLGLPPLVLPDYPSFNRGNYSPVSQSIQQRLHEYFAPYNRQLFEALQQDWGWNELHPRS